MTIPSTCMAMAIALSAAISDLAFAAELHVPLDFATPQDAINVSSDGDVIIVSPGTYGPINPLGRAITIRSEDPSDPQVIATTIIDGGGSGPAVALFTGERLTTIFDGLTITGGSNSVGGGFAILGADPLVRNCVIRDNEATNQGGGVYLSLSSAVFENCMISNNEASEGGGVYGFDVGWARLVNCKITENESFGDGGGVSVDLGFLRVLRCLIADNFTSSFGGGLAAGGTANLEIVSSLIRDNNALQGGGIGLPGGSVNVYNSTIVDNIARSQTGGGAISGFNSQPIIHNSIVRRNGAMPLAGVFSFQVVSRYSNVENDPSGIGTIDADPLFVDPDNNDFRIQPGSPSENTGFNGWVRANSLDDFGGAARIQNGTVDMGAFEVAGSVAPRPRSLGPLVVGLLDTGNMADGRPLPLLTYEPADDTWTELIRHLPTHSITADSKERCFWLHNGETFTLNKLPYDTLRLEEAGVIKYQGRPSRGTLSGLAVRNGVLYGTLPIQFADQPPGFYRLDKQTAKLELLFQFPSDYVVWDMHYNEETDQMLLLSNAESLQPGQALGIFEIDVDTFELSAVQPWINPDPFNQAAWLQGLAVGGGRNYIFRSFYNELQAWDTITLNQVDTIAAPNTSPGQLGWVLGGMTWAPDIDSNDCPADITDSGGGAPDGTVDVFDLLLLLANWGTSGAGAGIASPNNEVDVFDLLDLLAAWGSC